MLSRGCLGLMLALQAVSLTGLHAGEVRLQKTHLCCGACAASVKETLGGVKGVTKVQTDVNTKSVSFQASDAKTAAAGIRALAAAGFFGKASYSGRPLAVPESGAKKAPKSDSLILQGLHVCCNACVTAVHKSLSEVKGVSVIEIDRNQRTVKLVGDSIVPTEAVQALNNAGFYGRVAAPKTGR
jgi:copper chaperone CopZ